MALSQKLEIRQSQALVMTPQLMQAIKLLQLSSLDLAAYVDGELERNPLLERTAEGDGDREPDISEADDGELSTVRHDLPWRVRIEVSFLTPRMSSFATIIQAVRSSRRR